MPVLVRGREHRLLLTAGLSHRVPASTRDRETSSFGRSCTRPILERRIDATMAIQDRQSEPLAVFQDAGEAMDTVHPAVGLFGREVLRWCRPIERFAVFAVGINPDEPTRGRPRIVCGFRWILVCD
jgi:hypothetical protein